ncbi:3-hydroxybutyryl-CoA dehydrogenase [bacterium]|nr:3-hydroxybutyryl-CoA dehydrogenase [bacterium]|tara:strand:+ start:13086 stop:13931 length:846 start_codon:yes stop_codon:yes gene_type:complete
MINKITVIGSGTMGNGIAQVSAMAGFETSLFDISKKQLDLAELKINKNLDKGFELGKIAAEKRDNAKEKLVFTEDFEMAVKDSDLIIEAVPENMELKKKIFSDAEKFVHKETIFATNTTGLSITEMGNATKREDKVIGMHFFNPVHIMKLIEIVKSKSTSQETYEIVKAVSEKMGKQTVKINEAAGFVTSRMNALIGAEAFRMWEEGVASPEDIDKALKLGLNHPMGPFEMIDLVGLDVRLASMKNLEEHLGPAFKPSKKLEELVEKGRLGRKTGKGVYDY